MNKEFLIKLTVGIAIVIIIYLVLNKLISAAESAVSTVFGAGNEGSDKTVSDVDKELKNAGNTTLPLSSLQSIANSIFNTARFSDTWIEPIDHNVISKSLKEMANDADVLTLIKSFGTHNKFAFGVPTSTAMDLFEFIKDTLNSDEIDAINSAWTGKGITHLIV